MRDSIRAIDVVIVIAIIAICPKDFATRVFSSFNAGTILTIIAVLAIAIIAVTANLTLKKHCAK